MKIFVASAAELYDAVERANSNSDITEILLHEGEYELDRPLEIKRSGLTISGTGKGVQLKGSRTIPLPRGEGVRVLDLFAHGMTELGRFGKGPFSDFWEVYEIPKPHLEDEGPGLEAFFGGERLPLSRYPKEGEITIKPCGASMGESLVDQALTDKVRECKEGEFLIEDGNLPLWADEAEPLLVGFWRNDWATQRHGIVEFDAERGYIKVDEPYHNYGYCETGHFFAYNMRFAIEKEGEWAIDRKGGKLYILPKAGQYEVELSLSDHIIRADGVGGITLRGLEMSQCRKSAVKLTNCSDCTLEDCNIANTGAWGIIADDCEGIAVSRCNISHCAGGGIAMRGGDRDTLTSSRNSICECDISYIGEWHKTYHPAIEFNGVGMLARGNRLHDLPHSAIMYHGNEHILEHNEIYRVCLLSNDAGAIYAGRDWTDRGIIIRYNKIHSLDGFEGKGCIGLYFDDADSSAEVYGNEFWDIQKAAIQLGGGRDFYIHDNVFRHCNVAMMMDNRLREWCGDKSLLRHLGEVDYRNDVWRAAYPELYDILEKNYKDPENNRFENNKIFGGDGIALRAVGTEEFLRMSGNEYTPIENEEPFTGRSFRYDYWKLVRE